MKGDKMFELYSEYVGENVNKIVDDFCKKIKKEQIGNLTLDEYSRFRFWKEHLRDELKGFYERYKDDTKDEKMSFSLFCEFLWHTLDSADDLPDNIKGLMASMKSSLVGQA